jgi:hypothetical protein
MTHLLETLKILNLTQKITDNSRLKEYVADLISDAALNKLLNIAINEQVLQAFILLNKFLIVHLH